MTDLEGVVFLDHTADVGIDVAAPSLPLLYHRAARGMLALLRGEEEDAPAVSRAGQPAGAREVSGSGRDAAATLAAWLREVHFLHEVGGRDYVRGDFHRLDDTGFVATVHTEPAAPAVREIKGVTYHELRVERSTDGWTGRVIFDV